MAIKIEDLKNVGTGQSQTTKPSTTHDKVQPASLEGQTYTTIKPFPTVEKQPGKVIQFEPKPPKVISTTPLETRIVSYAKTGVIVTLMVAAAAVVIALAIKGISLLF